MAEKIIIDCDTGVDDALAIMCALSQRDKVEVIGITCVQGNVDISNVCHNTLRVLKACDRLDIPVYRGAESSLVGIGPDATYYHGKDGMGDAANPEEVDMNLIQSEHATLALIRLVNQYPGEITLVALAPLTNIALALRLDPSFGSKLKKMVIMGGNIEGKGNTSPGAEFNFHCDAESAYVVLKEIGCHITVISWELCLDNGCPWDWFDQWHNTNTKKGHFQKSITANSVKLQKDAKRISYRSCDLLAMTTVVDSSLVMETEEVYAEVELQGHLTRGQMVCDWRQKLGKPTNITVVKRVNADKVLLVLEKML